MAATDVEICNLALSKCGVKRPLTSLADTTAEAYACNAVYSTARENMLTEADWRFATKRAAPTAIKSGNQYVTRMPWNYTFQLPTDCLKVRFIHTGLPTPLPSQKVPFDVEPDDAGTGLIMLSNQLDPTISYTFRNTSVPTYPAYFVDALAWYVAFNLILPLAMKPDLGQMLAQGMVSALRNAIAKDLGSTREAPEPDSEFIQVR